MSLSGPPIWCRVYAYFNETPPKFYTDINSILLILTVGSFLPQILRFQTKQTTSGVSSLYILWNLIHATEQFTIYVYAIFTEGEPDGSIFLHSPPTVGDRFSLWHCAVVTILFLTL
jgi:uncharacterized protein with PQ loop repeat